MSDAKENGLFLQDTMSRSKSKVFAEKEDLLRFYCCGPTVYGAAHIGNFRTFVAQDLFRRVTECNGLKTLHVRNLTDVDDKTIRGSIKAGQGLKKFTDHWKDRFHNDCSALGLLKPHVEPSAVAHIAQQIQLVENLLKLGHAYTSEDGSVYFRISSFGEYGKLSKLKSRDLSTGASRRTTVDDEYSKESLGDFALWKGRRPEDGDNFWESPWGQGRPGWHLECSAMCREYLGDSFDLHSGGEDLVFPHHENEIAQSICSSGKPFARHWFHIAHLMVDGGKMSKSLGNMYTLDDLTNKGYAPEVVRYALLSGHYRQPLNFTFSSLEAARSAIGKLLQANNLLGGGDSPSYEDSLARGSSELGPFNASWEALLDDLNAPKALGALFSAIKKIDLAGLMGNEKDNLRSSFWFILNAFGICLPKVGAIKDPPTKIKVLAEKRLQARLAKNWADADKHREKLNEAGWLVRDVPSGFELIPK
ncbi:MAG: cysteine--tRNA ligase [Opitutae bacterium]|nr:cysteine--tRNA ligase [Opitutae bacterium]|tara:strand:- start:2851 stop:4278 length:1428 start_codon:yes stop_codon:yes gene_type:complete